jgi:hypothetical protein
MNSMGCQIPDATVRPLFIVLSSPGFNHELRFLQRQKPVLVETFIPKLAVEALDKRILHRLPRLNEVQVHPMLGGPGIQGRPGEFRPVVQDQRLRQRPCGNSRSRIRHTRAPPIDTSTSITGTSLEHRSVIVKHLNRRPVTSRSWTKSSA